jgi:hypothetical protein
MKKSSKAASSSRRTIPQAVRELCLAFPDAEEFESHGTPNFRARKGKVFACFCVNHHGDGHVALWLNTPALEQSRLLAAAPKQLFKPPYVGPSGWIGVELNRGFSWKRVRELVRMAYDNSSPAKLVARVGATPATAAPAQKMRPVDIDRMKAPRAQQALARMRKICLALPETSESASFGSPTWRVGKRAFASLYDHKGLTAAFWVGIERQGPLEMDPRFSIPPYLGHQGWIALDMVKGISARALEEFLVESFRHFATRRAIVALDATKTVA